MAFKEVESKMNLPKAEEEILAFWNREKIFEKSLDQTKDLPKYNFYDGPPFATGTPHYGHLLASAMKDIVPRYWTMKGFYVERVWGWDCHGLPIENIAEKELGYTHKKDIEKLGVGKFNDICRSNVLEYVAEWKKVINRFGRWVDMDNAYKTMDLEYMESVWWTFKRLWDMGLIYEDYRSMHICPRCETTLSQSEVTEGYKMVKDLSATAKFQLLDLIDERSDDSKLEELDTYILAWTTTPWTLLANAALAVGSDIDYVRVKAKNSATEDFEYLILAKARLKEVMKDLQYEIIEEFKGKKIVGSHYKPLFDYFQKMPKLDDRENGWQVYPANFVTTDDGTGIVHIAPAFGEDDMQLGQKFKLPFLQHIGMDGIIRVGFGEFSGLNVKPRDDVQATDVEIIKYLAHHGMLFSKEKYEHSYPHCWRCDTPLLNYATTSWFVAVTKIKAQALESAKNINWSPEHIKKGRFGKWLEGARDWSISRQRFWASVIPIWRCDCGQMEIIGSIDELKNKSNQKITKIIFARHGESEKNVRDIESNSEDKWPLTEKGKADAEFVADNLAGEKFDLIISSNTLRARETAEIINKKHNLPIEYERAVSELDFGLWNDQEKSYLKKNDVHFQEYQKIRSNPEQRFHFKMGKVGESRKDVSDRVKLFMDKLNEKHAGKTILIVSHAGINAAIHKSIYDIGFDEYFKKGDIDHRETERFYLSENGKPFDLHKDTVDNITFDCPKCGKEMHRIPDVLDTWFDSGSMPYAQLHYPFENKENFDETFPADYIAEYQDQCRAWFYYLHIIATAVTGKISFKNAVVSGTILAEDGKKMSKRLKNYPDPVEMINKYGADVLRFYLTTSTVMQSENLNFKEAEMAELHRGIFRMLWNSYSFFVLYANIDKWSVSEKTVNQTTNLLDKWILSELNSLMFEVNLAMDSYNLVKASRLFIPFVDNLSNWYIRRSRKRFWKSENDGDKESAYHTLYEVLISLAKLMAPFMPFLSEEIYLNLTEKESVHLERYPQPNDKLIDKGLNEQMTWTRKVVEMGLSARAASGIKVRQPLVSLTYHDKKLVDELEDIIAEEINVKSVIFSEGDAETVVLNTDITEELRSEGLAREIIRNIQELRKKSEFRVEDRIRVNYSTESVSLGKVIKEMNSLISKEVLAESIIETDELLEKESKFVIDGEKIQISIQNS